MTLRPIHHIATRTLGIETFKCKQYPGENGCACVTVIDGERVFLGSNVGGIRKDTPYILDRFDLEYMRTFDLAHSSRYSYIESQLPEIKAAGIPVSFDFSDDSSPAYIAASLAACRLRLHLARRHASGCSRSRLNAPDRLWPALAVASRGALGLAAFDGEGSFYQPAIPVRPPIDTMGAGDFAIFCLPGKLPRWNKKRRHHPRRTDPQLPGECCSFCRPDLPGGRIVRVRHRV